MQEEHVEMATLVTMVAKRIFTATDLQRTNNVTPKDAVRLCSMIFLGKDGFPYL